MGSKQQWAANSQELNQHRPQVMSDESQRQLDTGRSTAVQNISCRDSQSGCLGRQ